MNIIVRTNIENARFNVDSYVSKEETHDRRGKNFDERYGGDIENVNEHVGVIKNAINIRTGNEGFPILKLPHHYVAGILTIVR